MILARQEQVLSIIAEEVDEPLEEFRKATELEFSDLGIDRLLSKCILDQVRKDTGLDLPTNLFELCSTVGSLIDFLEKVVPSSSGGRLTAETINVSNGFHSESNEAVIEQPLSIRLHGSRVSHKKTVFLLPDGSGSAMSYARIPSLGPGICLYGLNSPFLSNPSGFTSIPELAPIWALEIRRLQPKGPYILGGWSAGGYYCFEVAKYLMYHGTEDDGRPVEVEKLILIDSPCRNVFEALPMVVVDTLSSQGLMGNWGDNEAPEWLLNHFDATIKRVDEYQPSPLTVTSKGQSPPKVFLIWATDGVYAPGSAPPSGLDMTVKVTKFMLEDRHDFGPNGWDRLFPKGTQITIARTSGTHFTLIFPPNSLHIGSLLRDILSDDETQRKNKWDRGCC